MEVELDPVLRPVFLQAALGALARAPLATQSPAPQPARAGTPGPVAPASAPQLALDEHFPPIGSTPTFAISGASGAVCALYGSAGPAQIELGAPGTLFLDPFASLAVRLHPHPGQVLSGLEPEWRAVIPAQAHQFWMPQSARTPFDPGIQETREAAGRSCTMACGLLPGPSSSPGLSLSAATAVRPAGEA
jgi:hypothetical protein